MTCLGSDTSVVFSITCATHKDGPVNMPVPLAEPMVLHFPRPVFFLAAVSSLGARAFIVAQNSSLDAQIEAWCRELTMSTGGMVNVQYRTRYTGWDA